MSNKNSQGISRWSRQEVAMSKGDWELERKCGLEGEAKDLADGVVMMNAAREKSYRRL